MSSSKSFYTLPYMYCVGDLFILLKFYYIDSANQIEFDVTITTKYHFIIGKKMFTHLHWLDSSCTNSTPKYLMYLLIALS